MTTAVAPRTDAPPHWCAALAGRSSWPHAERLRIHAGAGISEAWAAVTVECGITEDQLAQAIAKCLRLSLAHWDSIEPQATKLVTERLARKHHVFPLREDHNSIYVATADPNDMAAEQEVAFASGRNIVFEVASPEAIRAAIDAGYAPESAAASLLQAAGSDVETTVRLAKEAAPEEMRAADAAAVPVVGLANLILHDGVKSRASDIHVEPGRLKGVVRFRVDGVMREYLQLPMPVFNRVVSRIKVMGGLDIADRMRPQDGRSRIEFPDGRKVDLRLSTVPTRDSEKMVIRILDTVATRTLQDAGLPAPEAARIEALIAHRDGIVLMTGPTGSGKTTTLYGAIAKLANGLVNITTIEDPVEYEVGGITQIQIETKRGVTFASTLRAVLRQDPDIVFVGEIRDAETAETATHAALTGHLVLSTLHTNDAIGVIARMSDLGLDRATIATSLRGAIAQRLVRQLCTHCAVPVRNPLTPDEVRLEALTGLRPARRAVGCEQCAGTGYLGRIAIAEVLVNSPAIEGLISTGQPLAAILRLARSEGMRLLSEVGLEAVRNGRTTLQEVERVIGLTDLTPAPAKPRVLVVDDDPCMRGIVATLLQNDGFEVECAADGTAALERIASGPGVDLVLLDLGLPGLDGRAVLQRLRADRQTERLPVIILTGSEDESLESELIDDGADDYLRKPIDARRLSSRAKSVLRRARGARD